MMCVMRKASRISSLSVLLSEAASIFVFLPYLAHPCFVLLSVVVGFVLVSVVVVVMVSEILVFSFLNLLRI